MNTQYKTGIICSLCGYENSITHVPGTVCESCHQPLGRLFFPIEEMSELRKETWKECLLLWEAMSIKPNCHIEFTEMSPKQDLLLKLGLGNMENYCPFCDQYFKAGCVGCPIARKVKREFIAVACQSGNCPHLEYSNKIIKTRIHSQKLANTFYKWLIDIAKSEGYKPDISLKGW